MEEDILRCTGTGSRFSHCTLGGQGASHGRALCGDKRSDSAPGGVVRVHLAVVSGYFFGLVCVVVVFIPFFIFVLHSELVLCTVRFHPYTLRHCASPRSGYIPFLRLLPVFLYLNPYLV